MTQNPILVTVTRNGLLESFHRGSWCVVDENNRVLHSSGDIERKVFTRSAMKFIQTLPLIESGAADHFGFTPEEIAVMCASHNGEEKHIEVVKSILAKAGIPENNLGCGAHLPFYVPASEHLIAAGKRPTSIHNNCSGKHSGFLSLAKFLGQSLDTYLDPEGAVQKLVRQTASEMYEVKENELHAGVDGCSAPNFALPLLHHAIGFKNLVCYDRQTTRGKACERILNAITEFPFMVAGTDRFCTDLMRETKGRIIGKVGAEGVYGMALRGKKIGIAIKVDDGAMGPQYNVALAILEKLNALTEAEKTSLENYRRNPIVNFMGIQTGVRESTV